MEYGGKMLAPKKDLFVCRSEAVPESRCVWAEFGLESGVWSAGKDGGGGCSRPAEAE
ncbi:hypothetical protein FQA47_022173 [Oryzias melastigma]|uniref:Uncharacterized protein n=1 Tax=Oryzias melastigma TaxID=30732 RepID=A0A834FN05_ORYME|nr:hypothetical protein FQA47_022173 [Oryzias melastigma]